jgi:hypothetical protein
MMRPPHEGKRAPLSSAALVALAALCRTGKRLFLYPSAGSPPPELFDLPYDAFVLVDRGEAINRFRARAHGLWLLGSEGRDWLAFQVIRTCRDPAQGLFLRADNNEVLARVHAIGGQLHGFAGVNDGCCEGGNYECVNNSAFLQQVLGLCSPEGLTYFTDHSLLLFPAEPESAQPPSPRREFLLKGFRFLQTDAYLRHEPGATHPGWVPLATEALPAEYKSRQRRIFSFQVEPYRASVQAWTGNGLSVTFEHANIAEHLGEMDGVIISKSSQGLCTALSAPTTVPVACPPFYFFNPQRKRNRDASDSVRYLLEEAARRGWRTVGTTAFGGGAHQPMLAAFATWRAPLPTHVRVFHLDRDDFADIATELQEVAAETRSVEG